MTVTVEHDDRLDEYRDVLLRFRDKIPVDVRGLCKALGASLEVRDDLPTKISGFILKENGKYHILCSGNDPIPRQNFTIAHELAHYMLHQDVIGDKYPENFLLRGGLSSEEETEANQLAADILMPYPKVHKYINDRKGNVSISKMAEDFGVSRQALSIRLGIPFG